PCINHGIKGGLVNAQTVIKNAVAAGYWHTFRFDPRKADAGQNPFTLDSKEPKGDYQAFLKNEVRYSSLTRSFPERAEELFARSQEVAKDKYNHLVALADLYGNK
ncbi:MAG: hypothetical protein RR239_02700, partial [Oscillospiraceae bacterium]